MASNVGLGVCLIVCTIAMLVMAIAFQWKSGSSLQEMEMQIIEYERRDHEILCNFREMRKDIRTRMEPWEQSERFTDSLDRALIHDGAKRLTMDDLTSEDDEAKSGKINFLS